MADPSVEPAKVNAEILAGRYDGHLVELVEAVQQRFNSSDARKFWRITFDDLEWTEETVTLGEVATVERVLGVTWHDIDPAASAGHLQALIAAHLAEGDAELKFGDAMAKAKTMPMGDLLDVLSHYEKTTAPKG